MRLVGGRWPETPERSSAALIATAPRSLAASDAKSPWKPPMGWWIMIRALGTAKRLPPAPPASRKAPMLAAWPRQMVDTCGFTYCMVS